MKTLTEALAGGTDRLTSESTPDQAIQKYITPWVHRDLDSQVHGRLSVMGTPQEDGPTVVHMTPQNLSEVTGPLITMAFSYGYAVELNVGRIREITLMSEEEVLALDEESWQDCANRIKDAVVQTAETLVGDPESEERKEFVDQILEPGTDSVLQVITEQLHAQAEREGAGENVEIEASDLIQTVLYEHAVSMYIAGAVTAKARFEED